MGFDVLARGAARPAGTMDDANSAFTTEESHAMPSSTTSALSRHPLTRVLAIVPDPRYHRGVRHRLDTMPALAAMAALAGCRTLLGPRYQNT